MTASPIPDFLVGAEPVTFAAGDIVFRPGDPCRNFVYLQSGAIRVDLLTRSGKAMMLYRFGPAETCILTTSCLLSAEAYNAEAHVEETAAAHLLSERQFHERLGASEPFRRFVFSAFSDRISALLAKIENVAFTPIDVRLAARALELADADNIVVATHDRLADDIGSAREVISRKLAAWEKDGWIERRRGAFVILDPAQLQSAAKAW